MKLSVLTASSRSAPIRPKRQKKKEKEKKKTEKKFLKGN